MPVVTLFFQTLYAFVIVHLGSQRVVHVNATAHPSAAWVVQPVREATPFGETAQGLAQQTPELCRSSQANPTMGEPVALTASSAAPAQRTTHKLITVPVLNGLHHGYAWAT